MSGTLSHLRQLLSNPIRPRGMGSVAESVSLSSNRPQVSRRTFSKSPEGSVVMARLKRVGLMSVRPRRLPSSAVVVALLAVVAGLLASSPAQATVSGDNGRIAFVTDRDGNAEIYVMNADGTDPVNLTNDPAADTAPNWSADGGQITFVSDRDGDGAIFVMDDGGSYLLRLAAGGDPAWSPNGTRIAFTSGADIHVMNVDGSGATRVTDSASDPDLPPWALTVAYEAPAWSPDGSRLAFIRTVTGPTPTARSAELFVLDVGGGAPPVLLAGAGWGSDPPDWSPDGTQIAVTRMSVQSTSAAVVVVNSDGTGTATIPTPPGYTHSQQPAWSPDGTVIASNGFHSLGAIPSDVLVRNADGSGAITNLTSSPAWDRDPVWQPRNPYPAGLVDPATGLWYLRDRDGLVTSFYYGDPGDVPMLGDWDCDGVDTPGLYRQSDGFVYLRNSSTAGPADLRFFFGNPGDVPLAGDFDGDDCDTVSVYRPAEGRFYIINQLGADGGGLGAAESTYLFGDPGDQPFVGDFDGDGVDTVGLHRATIGLVYQRNSHSQGIADTSFVFGDPGDRLVTYDWNGDGRDAPGLFRPATTTFYFRFSNSAGFADAQYISGDSDWIPVAGTFGP